MMRKLSTFIGILAFATFSILLLGYFFLDWKITTIIPFSVVSIVLFLQSLSITTIKTPSLEKLGLVVFYSQFILLTLFIVELIEIALCWKWMFLLLIFSFLLFLHDLILRYTNQKRIKVFTLSSGVLAFCILLLSFLYLQNYMTNFSVYIGIIAYSLFALFCVWTKKEAISK